MSEKSLEGHWSGAADGWARWAALRAAIVPATERMLDLAGVGPGCRVLDVGCGSGEQTVMAAQRVGAAGHVLATDLAAGMIAATDRTVAAAGLGNVSTRVCAVEALAGGSERFDAAIGRQVLMLVHDPVEAARAVLSVLRPGGRFAAIVHGDPAGNPMNQLATDILARHGGKDAGSEKSPFFRLASLARLEEVFRQAGFEDVTVTAVPMQRVFDNAASAVAMVRESWGACFGLLAGLSDTATEAAWAELHAAYSTFEGPHGCVLPAEVNLAGGRKPA